MAAPKPVRAPVIEPPHPHQWTFTEIAHVIRCHFSDPGCMARFSIKLE